MISKSGMSFLILLLVWGVAQGAESKKVEKSNTVTLSSTVSGNQEQPKVLYIVPWKAPEVAAATRQNLHSQLLSVFSHVDRQALQRELKQYGAVGSDADGAAQSAEVE